ncbi:hypothetical protein GCM10022216_02530 [Sphingobacterium kyonggiense]|uniref:Uncharacterized protein n=1 Tax=Sphingobacterium kyonggiense TaxID=714075 RepID=A0ABP7Y865_9SPHI
MKAISKRQHQALIAALQQLKELSVSSSNFSKVPNFGKVSEEAALSADGFLPYIQSLSERFSHYEALLSQLADCIAEYEALHKEVRVNVVAPVLRQVKKETRISQRRKEQYRLAVEYVTV